MLTLDIPGGPTLELQHLILDFNGTLAIDGRLIDGVAARLQTLAKQLEIHVLTADTFGSAQGALTILPVTVSILPPGKQTEAKGDYISKLGADNCVSIGNGRNDRLLVQTAALGMVVLQDEGVAVDTMQAADIVVPNILAALDLLRQPRRLQATLRI